MVSNSPGLVSYFLITGGWVNGPMNNTLFAMEDSKKHVEKLIKKYSYTFAAVANSSQAGTNHRPDDLEFHSFEAFSMVCFFV